MSTNVLLAFATSYGSTQEVAEAVAAAVSEGGIAVEVQPAREIRTLEGYSAIVLGAPLYMYRWHKDAHKFLKRHRKALVALPTAVFALGPVQDPHNEGEWRDSHSQLEKELAKHAWFKPVEVKMFGGKFDPEALRFPLNKFAGSQPATDIRDWSDIQEWGSSLAEKLVYTRT